MAALHRPTCDGNWTIKAIGDACAGNATNYDELRQGLAQLAIDGCKPFIPRYESSTGEPKPDPEPESGPASKPGEWSPKLDLEPESKSEEPSSEPDPELKSKPEPDPDYEPMVKLLNKFKERVDKMDGTVNDPRIDAVLDISRKLCRMGGAVPLLGPALNVVSEILGGVEQARENINDLIEVWRVKKTAMSLSYARSSYAPRLQMLRRVSDVSDYIIALNDVIRDAAEDSKQRISAKVGEIVTCLSDVKEAVMSFGERGFLQKFFRASKHAKTLMKLDEKIKISSKVSNETCSSNQSNCSCKIAVIALIERSTNASPNGDSKR